MTANKKKKRVVVTFLAGGLVVLGVTVGVVQMAESAPSLQGPDPAQAHRKDIVQLQGGIVAPKPPLPLGQQLANDPDARNALGDNQKGNNQQGNKQQGNGSNK